MAERHPAGFDLANLALAALFLVAAALQYNDPDPELWMPLYLGAMAGCLLVWRAPAHWLLPAAVAAVALGWAATMAPTVLPRFVLADLVRSMKAENPAIEESRELGGLLIVAAWMLVLTARAVRARRRG